MQEISNTTGQLSHLIATYLLFSRLLNLYYTLAALFILPWCCNLSLTIYHSSIATRPRDVSSQRDLVSRERKFNHSWLSHDANTRDMKQRRGSYKWHVSEFRFSPSSFKKSLLNRRPLGSLPMKRCTYSVPWS